MCGHMLYVCVLDVVQKRIAATQCEFIFGIGVLFLFWHGFQNASFCIYRSLFLWLALREFTQSCVFLVNWRTHLFNCLCEDWVPRVSFVCLFFFVCMFLFKFIFFLAADLMYREEKIEIFLCNMYDFWCFYFTQAIWPHKNDSHNI